MNHLTIFFLLATALSAQFVPNQYIVELKEDVGASPADKLRRVRSRQARVEASLGGRGFRVLERTERVANTLVMEVPEGSGDARSILSQSADVARVHKVRIFHKTLDRAAEVHGVTAAWQRLGIEKAGAGMKIGILDSGIQTTHPGFQNESLPALEGYPKISEDGNLTYTNRKIIVARSYASLFSRRDPDTSALDRSGHGTAVAMCAAGEKHDSPRGAISGMAPAAYLGVYKIFDTPGINDGTTDAAILKAIDDAVADCMDVINLSFGTMLAARPENDIVVMALARAEAAGVIAVVSAGNNGPGVATLGSPASAPTALTVGASENSRIFASTVSVSDGTTTTALVSSRTPNVGTLSGTMTSIEKLDPTRLACSPLPSASLTGRIALIERGVCLFDDKLRNAASAGAIAAVIYSDEARPTDLINPTVSTGTLPTLFITRADGLSLLSQLRDSGQLSVTLDFSLQARDASPNRLANFS
jgi:minor extracellular serine protease Vpr